MSERGFLRNGQSMEDLRQKWPSYVADLFDPSSPARFYLGWNGDVGASNIPANIIDQFSRPHIAYALIRQFGRNHQFKGSLLDFGCGTAAVSLSWQVTCANQSGLLLSDFENLPREFVRYYIKKYPRFRRELVDIDLKEIPDYSIDGILCIHVLEHLPNPTTLFKLISSKLKTGGIFIVEAPWGGHPEHLKEAPTDWNEEGGKELLSTEYTMLKKMNPYVSLSGVYKKK
ncbi:MAG: methyltransferase domain-containing protein [Promethearchaeati archaeon SRVP18_Atabeyarchaeia-1]